MTTVPPPKSGLVPDADAPDGYTSDLQLVAAVMEARGCPKGSAEDFIAEHGEAHARNVVSARWSE
jgi:hypothetical protein